MNSRIRCDTSW